MTRYATPLFIAAFASVAVVEGFTNVNSKIEVRQHTTELYFGIPTFGKKDEEEEPEDPKLEKKKIGMEGLFQLITAGAGAPFLGDFQGVDKETGNFMFSLEANNLVDEDGKSKQTSMPYFESGWVDPKDLEKEEKKKKEGGFRFW
ncbi:unnamed protein product [Pseudo-nitzschia multistriata]|uniref:Uncharacterized protein n=1 Tax=Pseudo-nitzschia multistriata TaxID=183589 RepID=A0A448ZI98_9STRA|nr:unnamed protein product [Pseudo-nitzschia multistriata]